MRLWELLAEKGIWHWLVIVNYQRRTFRQWLVTANYQRRESGIA